MKLKDRIWRVEEAWKASFQAWSRRRGLSLLAFYRACLPSPHRTLRRLMMMPMIPPLISASACFLSLSLSLSVSLSGGYSELVCEANETWRDLRCSYPPPTNRCMVPSRSLV